MAEGINVDTLTIEIGASSDAATHQVQALTVALQSLKRTLNGKWNNPIRDVNTNNTQGKNVPAPTAQSTKIKIDASDADKARHKISLLNKTLSALKRIAFYRAVRSAIKAITDAISTGAENAYWYSKNIGGEIGYIADAMDRLASVGYKTTNQLGAAWVTLKAAVAPVLIELLELVTRVADAVTQLFAAFSGKISYMKAVDYTKEAYENTQKGAKAAKEWKNQLMGFDEINRLEAPSDSSSGSSTDKTPDYENMFEVAPINEKLTRIVDTIKAHLKEIELFAYGSLLGIGLMLTLTGANVPLGLGLMAVGAVGLAHEIAEHWDWITANIQNTLTSIGMIASGAIFGVGLIMALSGANIPLGLGLMAAGLAGAATIAALTWDEIPDNIREVIGKIDLIVGGALLAMGAVLAFSGANVLGGIALMIAGGVAVAAGGYLNWDYLSENISNKIAAITMIVGGAALAIGAIMTFTGANVPLGLGLMLAGGLAVGGSLTMNWDEIPEKMRHTLSMIELALGGAMTAIGAVLLFATPQFTALGLGLLVGGLALTGAGITTDWEYLKNKISGVLTAIGLVLGGAALGIGAVLTFTGANIPLGLGLMLAGATAWDAAVALNWDYIGNMLRGKVGEIVAIIGGAALAIGAILAFTGVGTPIGIGLMIAGAGSLGTVAALNWDYLNTMMRGKLGEITAIAGGALLAIGLILAFTGVGLPLGIGLMITGATALGTAAALNWDTVKEKISGVFDAIKRTIEEHKLAIGVLLCLTGVGIPLGLGLILSSGTTLGSASDPKWSEATDRVKDELRKIKGEFDEKLATIKETVSNKWDEVKTKTSTAWALIKGSLSDAWRNMTSKSDSSGKEISANVSNAWDEIKTDATSKWETIKTEVSAKWDELSEKASTVWDSVKQSISGTWSNIQTDASTVWDGVTGTVSGAWEGIKGLASSAWNGVKDAVTGATSDISTDSKTDTQTLYNDVTGIYNNLHSEAVRVFSDIARNVPIIMNGMAQQVESSVHQMEQSFTNMQYTVSGAFDTIRANIESAIYSIQGLDWSIPAPHLPHITVWYDTVYSGDGSSFDIPQFDVQWYAKGGILKNPTLFGMGDAGAEALVPLERNTEWIGKVAAEMNRQSEKNEGRDESNDDVIDALYTICDRIIRAMPQGGDEVDMDMLARSISKIQRRQARAMG